MVNLKNLLTNQNPFRPLQKSTNLSSINSSSTENLEPYEATTSSPASNGSYNGHSDNVGYRSLIESSDYRSLLVDDLNNSMEPVEDKLRQAVEII
jgi:hypothetical protein